ncbi:MAG TPA: helix-turn-helix transcriptional regulator [Actinophytocola sp.]|uniref:helix-turn-helix domain-containing protein n=1 Tax=Actinophytocola sp. TaxID=1872138 RepID=UPI002DB6554A|nr:helix-turn-helix transcriptional regulator [Actinophytocola sp.]HEU5472415.1 helix-turn-helix transcriptional regulator [Actinophytocola sp.]
MDDDMAREPEAIAELRRSLGAQLATFRQAAGLTQGQLGKLAICDRTTMVHIEKGRARAEERFWRTVDSACAAGGVLVTAYLELAAAKAEYEQRERGQRLATVRAKAAELRGQPGSHHGQGRGGDIGRVDMPELERLRGALLGHQRELESSSHGGAAPTAAQLAAGAMQAHRLYQRADYAGAARMLPQIIDRIEAAPISTTVPAQTKAAAYLVAAKLATKVGDSSLAWVVADRSLRLASETDRSGLIGIANYQVACALLGGGRLAEAEQTAARAADLVASNANSARSDIEEILAAQGALLLLLAIMAARRGDAHTAKKYLRAGALLAERLRQDGNWLWTAFGPTNVAIHELAVQVTLGDWRTALQIGERIDTEVLPAGLLGRRSQVHLELGWASVGQGDDGLAVLHLLEAERVAKQAVSRNANARALLSTLLARERKSATPGLRALAARAGVFQ